MAYSTYITTGSQVVVTSAFGPRWGRNHNGMDIVVYTNPAYIRAAMGGSVSIAGWVSGYGNCVYINATDGTEQRYGHMATTPSVSAGQVVEAGTILGIMGSTGNSTGPHLHYEVRSGGTAIDPSSRCGIPNAPGTYETTYGGPTKPPEPTTPPQDSQNGNVIVVTVRYIDNTYVAYAATQAWDYIYWNDREFYRATLEGAVPQIHTKEGNWVNCDTIQSIEIAGFDVSSLGSVVLGSVAEIVQSFNQISDLSGRLDKEVQAINEKIQTLETELTFKINAVETNLQNQIDSLDARVSALEGSEVPLKLNGGSW